MPTIAIIPWLNLAQPIVIDEFALIPLQSYRFTNKFEEDTVSRIVSAYYVAEKAVVGNPTLLGFTSKGLIDDLQPDESRRLSDFVELVAIAGIAKRKFFQMTGREYCNRDNFQLFLFQVSIPGGTVSYSTRRRDGSGNFMANSPRFRKPTHVDCRHSLDVDTQLLDSLLRAWNKNKPNFSSWDSVFESILNFNFANTDSDSVPAYMEAISLVSAYQRLLGTRSDEKKLINEFSHYFAPSRIIRKEDLSCTRLTTPLDQSLTSKPDLHAVREVWLRDFCTLRGNLAHGKLDSPYKPV